MGFEPTVLLKPPAYLEVMRRHVERLILVGDPEQLPSTVFSKKVWRLSVAI